MPATFPPAASPPWEPSPPGRPEGPPAPARPAGLWSGAPSLEAQLLDRRVVRLWGPLDDASVGRACAEMMALDATGDAAVQLYVGSSGGPLHLALTLIDTMDLLGVPVHVTCLGRAQGAAIGVVAAGHPARRRAPCPVLPERARGLGERPRQPVGGLGRPSPSSARTFRPAPGRGHRPTGRARGSRLVDRALVGRRASAPVRTGRLHLGAWWPRSA